MKKIGIITGYRIINYGSVLQAYATQNAISKMGYSAELVHYSEKKDLHWCISVFRNLISPYHWKLRLEVQKNKKNRADAPSEDRKKSFKKFINENIVESNHFVGWKQLLNGIKQYDAVIAGSDQIWHPCNRPKHYFTLDFVKIATKISYASSFGVSELPKSMRSGYEVSLSDFQDISVREQTGVEILRTLGLKGTLVADPTLLLTAQEWSEVATDEINEIGYIFCYFLGSLDYGRKKAMELKRITGFKIISISNIDDHIDIDSTFADVQIDEAGPAEFIEYIKKAEYVCTDSFHCSVFSIIFGKPFFVFKRFSDAELKSTNTRIKNLLTIFDLESRECDSKTDLYHLIKNTIDYGEVEKKLKKIQTDSLSFLSNALDGV